MNSWLPAKGLSRSSLVLDRMLHHLELSRNSWLPAKGLSRSSLVLDRTLHHLELSQEQPAPRSGFEPLHPWYCSGRNTTWNKSRCRRREVARILPCPPFHFSNAFEKGFTATAAIGRTLVFNCKGYRHTTPSGV